MRALSHLRVFAGAALAVATLRSAPAAGQLTPAEVAVVAARGDVASEQLAKYYLTARGIPEDNLCLVDVPREELCPREVWATAIRPAIRQWLAEHDADKKLRCLVTVRGVPLKIGPGEDDPGLAQYRAFLEGDRRQRLVLLRTVGTRLDAIAAHIVVATPDLPRAEGAAEPSELQAAQAEVERRLQLAQARVQRLEGEEQPAAAAQLQQLAMLAGGARVVLQGMERRLAETPDLAELRSQYDVLRGRAAGLVEMQLLVDQVPLGFHHDALMLAALERNSGLLGTIAWLEEQLKIVDKNETGASFDSELSLVLWPDDYQLLRWQPNYLREGYDNSQWPVVFPTLMVARIDAPTVDLCKNMIDAAIAVEEAGLAGKAYFDARGIEPAAGQPDAVGSYADYDQALRAVAQGIAEQTTLEVTLNDRPELFQAGQCPEASLYCGWYSLGKYVDAFDWQRGAVAYHLASGEAATLRAGSSEVWCKRLIEDGVAATIGPVFEPYLMAFPRPEKFFGLLLEGRLTLVECYYRTLPYNSWMMTLIGDPLYRPYKNVRVGRGAPAADTPAAE